MESYFHDVVCRVCGKTFSYMDRKQWVYRIRNGNNTIPVCSWGCIRTWEAEKAKKGTKRGRKKK